MRITPLDIRNHSFPKRVSGYDKDEVDGFLRMVSEDYESALRHASGLQHKIKELEERVRDLSKNETLLKETLTTAQQLADDLRQTAIKEAEVIVGQAELQGEKVLEAAHRRASQLAEDIREMKQLKTRLAASVRGAFETHLRLLDGLAAEPPGDPLLEGKVAYLRRSAKDAAGGES